MQKSLALYNQLSWRESWLILSHISVLEMMFQLPMKDISYPKPTLLPEVLSIEKFRGNAGRQKFQAILTDAKHHKLFDISPACSQTDLMLYLQNFPIQKIGKILCYRHERCL